jgi:hypothetical protein
VKFFWWPGNTKLLLEALSSVFDVSEGLVGDDATGAYTAGAADDLEAARLWTSASRLREALTSVSEMLASCRPSRSGMAVELAMVADVRRSAARRRAEALFRGIFSFEAR